MTEVDSPRGQGQSRTKTCCTRRSERDRSTGYAASEWCQLSVPVAAWRTMNGGGKRAHHRWRPGIYMGAVRGNYRIALREVVLIASRNASEKGHHPTIRRVSDDFFQSSVQHCCLLPSSALICREIPLRTSTTHKSCKHLSHFGHKASSLCHKSQTPSKTQKHTRRPSQVRERRSHPESSFSRPNNE